MKMNLHHAFAPAAYARGAVTQARETHKRQKESGSWSEQGLAEQYKIATAGAREELQISRRHVDDWIAAVTERAEQERAKVFTPATDPMERIAAELTFQRLYSRGDFNGVDVYNHLKESDPATRHLLIQEAKARGAIDDRFIESVATELSPEYAAAKRIAGQVPTIKATLGDHFNGVERMLNDPNGADLDLMERHTPEIFKDVADVEVDIPLD